MEKQTDKVSDGRAEAQTAAALFLLEVMSAIFNLLTTLFGIRAHELVDVLVGLRLVSDL